MTAESMWTFPPVMVESLRLDDLGAGDESALSALLDDEERRRTARLASVSHRREYAAAHGLLRRMIGECIGVDPATLRFTRQDPSGKPRLAEPAGGMDIDFSLTHTNGLVAAAVVEGAVVGIDAEPSDRRVEPGLARRFFAADEADWLDSLPENERNKGFFRLWTLKEALLKALGAGIAGGLASFSVRTDPPRILPGSQLIKDPTAWHFRQSEPGGRHILSLAVSPVRQ